MAIYTENFDGFTVALLLGILFEGGFVLWCIAGAILKAISDIIN